MSIEELKEQRAAITRRIRAEREARKMEAEARATGQYLRVVCHECRGDGQEHDHRSPAILGPCCSCNGRGFLWRRAWTEKRTHDMSFEGKEGTYPKRKNK